MTLVARLINAGAVHEVHCEEGKYSGRLYIREPYADREFTTEEAMEEIEALQKCGGLVCRRGEVDRDGS